MGDGRVEGETGDGSCMFRLWNGIIAGLAMKEADCSAGGKPATVAREEVMNAVGMSWGRHISHKDFTAWSTRPMAYLLFWTSRMGNSLDG